jgi:hypothetical protein
VTHYPRRYPWWRRWLTGKDFPDSAGWLDPHDVNSWGMLLLGLLLAVLVIVAIVKWLT